MKSVYFSNKKSLQIVSPNIRNDIKSQINNMGSFNLSSKYYTFLNKKNVNNLKESNFMVSLSTFGKKFILYITKYNQKKYCIFINKKNDIMTVTQLKFTDEIFNGTLFDGELVKNNEDKWIYLINDIAYYKGENIITKSFNDRQKIIENILSREHQQDEDNNESLFISKKVYFKFNNIKDLCERYINHLNYKCSGIYFKNTNNFSDNYLFIFPECRTDSKVLNNTNKTELKKTINDVNNEINEENEENEDDDLFGNGVEKIISNENQLNDSHLNVNQFNLNSLKLEKRTCKFLINTTIMPDIYELYCKNSNNNIDKHSYASVPDIETSEFIKSLFNAKYNRNEDMMSRISNGNAIYVECEYHKDFKKWIPYKRVESCDTLSVINQIQIILDSL